MRADPPPLPRPRHYPLARRARRVASLALRPLAALALVAGGSTAQELEPLPGIADDAPLDRTGEGVVRIAWETPEGSVWPGQRSTLAVRVEVDARFAAEHLTQPFARRLDLPLAIDAPRLPAILALREAGADAGPSLALGGEVVVAENLGEVLEDGAYLRVARIPLDVLAERPGEAELPALVARFAAAETFRDELLGRVPIDARLAFVRGEPAPFVVRRFPEDGRPPEFAGALGAFTLSARAEPTRVRVGDTLQLSVDVEGPAQADGLALPSAADQHGLHLVARHVTDTEGGWRIDEELVVESGTVREVRPLVLWSFDPDAESYRVARSAALPLVIAAAHSGAESEGGDESGGTHIQVVVLGLAAVVVLAAWTARRRRRRRAQRDQGRSGNA